MTLLRIATRRSALALAQAGLVRDKIRSVAPHEEVTLVEVETTGDTDRVTAVTELTELGAFVRGVQAAVLNGNADLAVHSCKDLPTSGPDGLGQWYPDRASPWDVLCGASLDGVAEGGRVGTGSPRRSTQLRRLRPDLRVVPIRGNVPTRLDKVHRGEVAAVVLAEAGLQRLRRRDDISHVFSLDEMVPAPAQAAICIEARLGSRAAEVAAILDDPVVRTEVEAERRVLQLTGAGCRAALGAFAAVEGQVLTMVGFVEDERGGRRAVVGGSDSEQAAQRLRRELGL